MPVAQAHHRQRTAGWALTVAVCLTLACGGAPAAARGQTVARSASTCPQVAVIGARGSGQKASDHGGLGPLVATLTSDLRAVLASSPLGVTPVAVLGGYTADSTTELAPSAGEVALAAIHPVLAAASWRRDHLDAFLASISRGVQVTLNDVRNIEARCPSALIVLAGYSQGAMVVHQAELKLTAAQRAPIAATVLIADGDRAPNTKAALKLGSAPARSEGVRRYLRIVARRDVAMPGSTVDICNNHDIVCDFTLGALLHARRDTRVHHSYTPKLLSGAAAWVAAKVLAHARGSGGGSAPQPAQLVAVNSDAACALTAGGGVSCWGDNEDGQLGTGQHYFDNIDSPCAGHDDCSLTPVAVPISGVVSVTGNSHGPICALLSSGGADCWAGFSAFGGAGDVDADTSVPVPVAGLSNATALSTGFNHSCALIAGGTVQCWGDDGFGQLGNGITEDHASTPHTVKSLTGATQITAGTQHSCALVSGGRVECWGVGPLGNGTGPGSGQSSYSAVPRLVAGLSNVRSVSAGGFTCAVLASGGVDCWGDADGITRPTPVKEVSGAVAVSAGYDGHACALVTGGRVFCWGPNDSGQLGNGTTTESDTAVQAVGITGVVSDSAGPDGTTCAALAGGGVFCWGRGAEGELGNGQGDSSTVPVAVDLP